MSSPLSSLPVRLGLHVILGICGIHHAGAQENLPVISASPARAVEGHSGTSLVEVRLFLSSPSADPVSVAWNTVAGTASAGTDFVAGSGTVVFAPGEIYQTIPIAIAGDSVAEPEEEFRIQLSAPTGASLGDSQAGVRIQDDEPVTTVRLNSPVHFPENNPAGTLTFAVGNPQPGQTLQAVLTAGTATSGVDVALPTPSTMDLGSASPALQLEIMDDASPEPDEHFGISLTGESQAVRFPPLQLKSTLPAAKIPVGMAVQDDLLICSDGTDLRIYRRTGTDWSVESVISGQSEGGIFAVALDQGIIAADFAATGIKIFSHGQGGWSVMATLPRTTAEADDRRVIALQDDTLIVGDPQPAGERVLSGEVRVYERHCGGRNAWGHRVTLTPATAQPDFGSAVTLHGPWLAASAPESFSVTMFRRSGTDFSWTAFREYVRFVPAFGRALVHTGDALVVSQTGPLLTSRRTDAAGLTWTDLIAQGNGAFAQKPGISYHNGLLHVKNTENSVQFLSATAGGQWVAAGTVQFGNNPSPLARQTAFDGTTLAVTGNGDAAEAPVLMHEPGDLQLTVIDDDSVHFSVDDISLPGGQPAMITVRLSRPLPLRVHVAYRAIESTAVNGSDFSMTSGNVHFEPNTTTASTGLVYLLPPEPGETAETFLLRLESPLLGTTGPDAVITIAPPLPVLGLGTNYLSVIEGHSGTRTATLPYTLSLPAPAGASFSWKMTGVTATQGSDFPASTGLVAVPEGALTGSFTVEINGDVIPEKDETCTIEPINGTGLAIPVSFPPMSCTLTILNDDTGNPVADSYSLVQGQSLTNRNVRLNDTGVESVTLVQAPPEGGFSMTVDGNFTFTPGPNQVGLTSFVYRDTFTITDRPERTATGSITIADGNVPPLIRPDTFTIKEGAVLDTTLLNAVHLLTNDGLFSAAGTAWNTILEVNLSAPVNGTLSNHTSNNGRFVFTPFPEFSGQAGFTYRVRDKDGWSEPAAVVIHVTDDLPFPPLQRLAPAGSQLHRSVVSSASFTATSEVETLFPFKAGQTVSFRALPGGTTVFGKMEIQDASGVALPGGTASPNGIENVPIPADGSYRVVAGQRGTAGTSTFHIMVNGGLPGFPTNAASPYPLDSARPAGSLRAAVAATMTSTQPHYYTLAGAAGETVHLYLQSNLVQSIRLLTAQGAQLAISRISPWNEKAAWLTHTFSAAGTYHLVVSGMNPADYTLQLHRGTDTHEHAIAAIGPPALRQPLRSAAAGFLAGRGVPAPGTPEPSQTFATFGDYGSGNANEGAVADMVKSWNPDFIIAAGDHNYELDYTVGTPTWKTTVGNFYGDFIKGRADNRYPEQTSPTQRFFPVPGNHDTGPDVSNGGELSSYFEYFHVNPGGPPRLPPGVHQPRLSYYKISQGNMDFFLLDSDNAAAGGAPLLEQRAWLKAGIAASNARWKFGVWHHPPFSSGASHGSHGFIQWGRDFEGLTAIFTGHDHIYERLNIGFGVTQFIAGIGGKSFYNFTSSPVTTSQFRYNNNHGALRVITGEHGVQFDFLVIGSPGGTLIDSHTIGNPPSPVMPSGIDSWALPVVSGSTLQLTTRTPRPPGLPQNQVDPALQLIDPSGQVVASDSGSAFDGKNAKLIHHIPPTAQPGEVLPWTVRILNEAAGIGEYEIRVGEPTEDSYQTWASLQALPEDHPAADPDSDGLPNLMEFLIDSNPEAAPQPPLPALVFTESPPRLQVQLPSQWTRPVTAILQSSGDLKEDSWIMLASKSSGESTWSSYGAGLVPTPMHSTFALPADESGGRKFYRLAFVLE